MVEAENMWQYTLFVERVIMFDLLMDMLDDTQRDTVI